MRPIATAVETEKIDVPKNFRENLGDIAGLAASIEQNGLQQPVGLRKSGERFDLIWGRRRLAAYAELEHPFIESMVYDADLPDDEMDRMRIVENIQREGIGPVDEALAIADALKHGQTEAELAELLGSTPNWIKRRARVAERLSAKLMKCLKAGEITIELAEVLARIATAKEQERVFSAFKSDRWAESFDDFLRIVRQKTHDLASAPFDVEAECADCDHRSDRQQQLGLFPDDVKLEEKGEAICLDSVCWSKKCSNNAAKIRKALRKCGHEAFTASYEIRTTQSTYGYQPEHAKLSAKGVEGILDPSDYSKAQRKLLDESKAVRIVHAPTGRILFGFNTVEAAIKKHRALESATKKEQREKEKSEKPPRTDFSTKNDNFYQGLEAKRKAALVDCHMEAFKQVEPDRIGSLRLAVWNLLCKNDYKFVEWFNKTFDFNLLSHTAGKEGLPILRSLPEDDLIRALGMGACHEMEGGSYHVRGAHENYFQELVRDEEKRAELEAAATAELDERMVKRLGNLNKMARKARLKEETEKAAKKIKPKKKAVKKAGKGKK